ncbi:hypothetical protein H257_02294 [Aphanomyces astaci]|uniref:Uncharacterized protein n=1 Tax=Aphanomyces astaci TaxID=112090 RepID=W4H3G3_APHAT|nr:hypothetical protein H257_02294 [Aphanomyces astaci]ETV85688.1 hypothetical protein H257_02294 [Aphanomyces astaci]|eukprot:XP_009824160.1 hypothetical protein H257_02294 [Aphanomyces astaci]
MAGDAAAVTAPLPTSVASTAPHARGLVRILLQLEGATLLVACVVAYYRLQGNWWVFAAGFFAGDLLSVGYAFGPAVGCTMYNTSHTFVGPTLMATLYLLWTDHTWLGLVAAIWGAHLGWERSLGYGLRYPDGFTSTHITVDQDPVEYVQHLLEPTKATNEGTARSGISTTTVPNYQSTAPATARDDQV